MPIIGGVVGVAGDVKRPAIFELGSRPEQLTQVIEHLAGGLSAFGYAGHVQVERVRNHQQVVVLDLPVSKMGQRSFAGPGW